MALGSPKGRRHRAKGWRKRKRGYGVLTHRGASQAARAGIGTREFRVVVRIERNIGASRERQYMGRACIAGSTSTAALVTARKALRRRGVDTSSEAAWEFSRCGAATGSTPTVVAKRALRKLTQKTWTR